MLLPLGGFASLIEGLIKIAILVGYMAAVSRMKDIHRMFQYHGAEHKTIFLLRGGRGVDGGERAPAKTVSPRCGTSFLLIVVIVSVLVTSFVTGQSVAQSGAENSFTACRCGNFLRNHQAGGTIYQFVHAHDLRAGDVAAA